MDNNINEETKFSFIDLIKPLKGRGRAILSLVIIASLLGGVIGLIAALCGRQYGTTLDFRYTPYAEKLDLIYVLNTETFAERLLLDENGLPPRSMCDTEAYDNALAAIQRSAEARQQKKDSYEKYKKLSYELNIVEIDRTCKYLEEDYTRLYEMLELYKSAASDSLVDENHIKMVEDLEKQVTEAKAAFDKYNTETYRPAFAQVSDALVDLEWATILANETKREAESLRETALQTWRSNKDVRHNVRLIMSSLSFKYTYYGLDEDDTTADALGLKENLSTQGGYITVTVNMPNDSASAEFLVESLKKVLPEYVEEVLEYSAEVYSSNCTLLSPYSQSSWINASSMVILPVIFLVAFNIVIVGAYCAVVIIRARSKNDEGAAPAPAPVNAKPEAAPAKRRLPYTDAE